MDQNQNSESTNEVEERGSEGGGGGGGGRYQRGPRPFVKIIISDAKLIHHKNIEFLRQFVSDSGKLRPRRQTGISALQQRQVAQAVKRARHLALLPFSRTFER